MDQDIFEKSSITQLFKQQPAFFVEPEGSLLYLQKFAIWALSWASRTQFALSIPTSLRSFQVLNIISFFHCLGRAKELFQVRGALKHFVTC
jgi:hypothetical protein